MLFCVPPLLFLRYRAHQFPGKPAPVLNMARPFAQDLVNNALRKGDRFVLYSFDKAPRKVFDATVSGNLPASLEPVPKLSTLSKVQGTNIRWAHYEGLKILESETQKCGAAYLVVLSDGYHDSPDAGDPNYTDFYIPQRLNKMPDAMRSRDYARLAKQFKSKNCAIGVQLAPNDAESKLKRATLYLRPVIAVILRNHSVNEVRC